MGVTETDSGAETGINEDGASDARPMRKPTLSSLSSDMGESRVDKSSLQTTCERLIRWLTEVMKDAEREGQEMTPILPLM